MRGSDVRTEGLFSCVSCEARVPESHPLRPIRAIVDEALEVLSPEFSKLYSQIGRPSIPPEKLLWALLLQAFNSARSERQLMEQLNYNLKFRWFVGWSMPKKCWGCADLGRDGVHQEPRPVAGGRCGGQVLGSGTRATAGQGSAVRGLFFGKRHAERALGEHAELQAEGWR